MVSPPAMCFVHGNTLMDLVSLQVTTRTESQPPNLGISV